MNLIGTKVSHLEPLRELTQLKYLSLMATQVTDLEPLMGMKLVRIYLHDGQQVMVPEELADRVVRSPLQPHHAARDIVRR